MYRKFKRKYFVELRDSRLGKKFDFNFASRISLFSFGVDHKNRWLAFAKEMANVSGQIFEFTAFTLDHLHSISIYLKEVSPIFWHYYCHELSQIHSTLYIRLNYCYNLYHR